MWTKSQKTSPLPGVSPRHRLAGPYCGLHKGSTAHFSCSPFCPFSLEASGVMPARCPCRQQEGDRRPKTLRLHSSAVPPARQTISELTQQTRPAFTSDHGASERDQKKRKDSTWDTWQAHPPHTLHINPAIRPNEAGIAL